MGNQYTRKQLLALPKRKWAEETTYDTIALVPTGKKHDSGYALIAIVGINREPVEIAAYCDDVCYKFITPAADGRMFLRTDMFYPSGVSHIWSWYYKFKVGVSLSSTEIELIPKGKDDNN